MVTGYDPGSAIYVNHKPINSSLIINSQTLIEWRPRSAADITAADLAVLFTSSQPLILWGSGAKFSMPDMTIRKPFIQQQRVLEAMHTRAACGTFNLLLTDNRDVLAVLLID